MVTTIERIDPAKAKEFFRNKITFTTGPVEVNRSIEDHDDVRIIDVRAAEDFQKGHVPTAVNVPKDQWHRSDQLSRDSVNILYCYSQTCHLAAFAAVHFADRGFQVMEMEGGFKTWQESGLPVLRD